MAADEDEMVGAPHIPLPRKITFWLFAGLVALAGFFYVLWGLLYAGWLDNGVYAVTIVLLLFGLAGMWITLPSSHSAAAPSAHPKG